MASQRIAHQDHAVTIGVDTHGDVHVAAAFTSDLGRPLGHLEIETTPDGYRRLLAWARRLGSQPRFGIQGTGSYGAGLARVLRHRPNRQTRHARGKSDPVDAEAAARAVLSGEATCVAKRHDNLVGMIRTLRVARSQVRRNSGSR
jgi:transposase